MIGIVDYGLGNVRAFSNIYKRLNIECAVVSSPDDLRKVGKIILPGVGSFDSAMRRLEASGFRKVLDLLVLKKCIPVLGVCVGMQVMAEGSQEGKLEGLGWIGGEVRSFNEKVRPGANEAVYRRLPLPHMGWNDIVPCKQDRLFAGLDNLIRCYFLHSYYFAPDDNEAVLAVTDYGGPFASAIRSKNIYGVQFHPEKSHGCGIQILKNFAEVRQC